MDGIVNLGMDDYLTESIDSFGEPIDKKAVRPVTGNLFAVGKSEELDEERKENFHRIVAKLLYVSKRVRVDINTDIAFLCTRVSKSTKEDWEKLGRLLMYLKGTLKLK